MTNRLPAVVITLIVAFLFVLSAVSHAAEYDFRKTRWGMTKQEVIKSEKSKAASDEPDSLIYATKILGLEAALLYKFINNKLVSSGYIIIEKYSNDNIYIDKYNDIVAALKKKYGTPVSEGVNWSDDLYKNDRKGWGTAVSIGHVKMITDWSTAKTKIRTILMGNNYKITLGITYRSIALESLRKNKKNKEIDSNL